MDPAGPARPVEPPAGADGSFSSPAEEDAVPLDPDDPDPRPGRRPVHLQPSSLALVFLGGAVGTAGRYGLEVLAPAGTGRWPVGTTIANLVGAFVLGLLLEALLRAGSDDGWRRRTRLLLGTGFCGGLTTYSTFAVEVDLLLRAHDTTLALLYLTGSVVLGLVAAVAGVAVAGWRAR